MRVLHRMALSGGLEPKSGAAAAAPGGGGGGCSSAPADRERGWAYSTRSLHHLLGSGWGGRPPERRGTRCTGGGREQGRCRLQGRDRWRCQWLGTLWEFVSAGCCAAVHVLRLGASVCCISEEMRTWKTHPHSAAAPAACGTIGPSGPSQRPGGPTRASPRPGACLRHLTERLQPLDEPPLLTTPAASANA